MNEEQASLVIELLRDIKSILEDTPRGVSQGEESGNKYGYDNYLGMLDGFDEYIFTGKDLETLKHCLNYCYHRLLKHHNSGIKHIVNKIEGWNVYRDEYIEKRKKL